MNLNAVAACLLAAVCLGSPLLAGDEPDPNSSVPKLNRFGPLRNYALFAPLPPGQQAAQPAPAPAPQKKQLTTTGKVLKWVGIGLMADSTLDFAFGAAGVGSCSRTNNFSTCINFPSAIWYGAGAVEASAGAVLFLIGIHKTQ